MTQLPIPIANGGKRYTHCEVVAPKTSVIADTEREAKKSIYSGILTFVAGGIDKLYDSDGKEIDEPTVIKRICRDMPYRTAEYLAIQIVLEIDPDDGFEGYYHCPRCGQEMISEDDPEQDTRDHISDLNVTFMEEESLVFKVEIDPPLDIKDKKSGEIIESIESLTLEYPTLGTCIAAQGKYGASGAVRQQFAFYVDSLKQINGEEIDQKTRSQWGMYIFENLRAGKHGPLAQISENVRRYGMENSIQKTCPNCGKVWQAPVDTSNFFGSALQSV